MAPGLYIKDMEGRAPDWAEIFQVKRKHKKAGRRDLIDYLVCNDEATLQWIVNLGCIDINPWTSRTNSDEQPDFIIIDLDPSDDDFQKAIATAKAAKRFFDKHNIIALPKTSGKTGIHLFLPCKGFNFPQARAIAENICRQIHLLIPDITTTNVTIEQRGNKLYLDPNQNDYADTVACAYSVRPYKLPMVSTPLEWKEINSKLDPQKFTIDSIAKRAKSKGDLFKDVLLEKNRMANAKVLKKFLV
jgi:bifunctional non-homologous end joining protein LigD